ncbi:hypothetical protein PCANC_02911 [Puccinia coronata f. sp. avenae]|uniref:Uncharacterized protein n=1 Tax=Puccinia coronata f. sp. avenae TaxID=200324 RepID=A0A2N5T8C0_9BASI|nr:hypothetical protein PCANC_02911 [Puccinia coronata f. sp. avenae]
MTSSDCTIALFKPKTVLGSPLAGIQLVAVLVKPGNQLGPASSLTKKLRFKDTPAAGDKWIMTVLNKPSKAEVKLDSITPNHVPTFMLVLSNSLANPKHIQSLEKTEMKIIKHTFHVPGTENADNHLLAKSSWQAGSHLLAKSSWQAGSHLLPKAAPAGGYLLAESSWSAGGYLPAESSRSAGGYLLAESSRSAGGYLLAESSRSAGGYLLAESSRSAGGYLLAESSRSAGGYLLAESSWSAGGYLLAESSWSAGGYLLAESSWQATCLPRAPGQQVELLAKSSQKSGSHLLPVSSCCLPSAQDLLESW